MGEGKMPCPSTKNYGTLSISSHRCYCAMLGTSGQNISMSQMNGFPLQVWALVLIFSWWAQKMKE